MRTLEIESVVAEHMQSVYRYAFRLAGRTQEAEDLTQQTFLIAQQRLHQVREPEKLIGWLFTVLRTCFLKSLRKKQPISTDALQDAVDRPTSEDALDFIDREHLQTALDRLSEEARVVVLLFYYEELSYKEIASEINVPIGTVMSRLARAKQRLRALLKEMDGDTADQAKPVGPSMTSSTRLRQEA